MNTLSVVVPTYNRAELLRATLRSINAQTLTPYEVIVVDDGSTDHTAEVCKEFRESVRYLKQANSGLSAARNAGIATARGDWIALCDSDDLWRPRKLEIQLAALEATAAQWSVTDFGIIDPGGNRKDDGLNGFRHAFALFQETNVTPTEHFNRWLRANEIRLGADRVMVYNGDAFGMLFEGNVALPSTAIIARDLIERAGPFNKTFRAEETEFFHRIAAVAPVAVVMQQLADYRIGHASLITGDAAPFVEDAIRSLNQAAKLRPQLSEGEAAAFRAGLRRLRMRLAYARLSSLDRRGARQAIISSWREDRNISSRGIAIVIASSLPDIALRGVHWFKRAIGRQLRRAGA
jgi:glycosyltransferase involved in cell wall biosynthesis